MLKSFRELHKQLLNYKAPIVAEMSKKQYDLFVKGIKGSFSKTFYLDKGVDNVIICRGKSVAIKSDINTPLKVHDKNKYDSRWDNPSRKLSRG